jgi:hypothetical protein
MIEFVGPSYNLLKHFTNPYLRLDTLDFWRHYTNPLLWYCSDFQTNCESSLSLMLRPTVSRSVYLGIKHPSGAYDQVFITVRQLRVCRSGALCLKRGLVRHLQWLLVLASAVILVSQSRWSSRPYFTVPDSRLPVSSPPTTRRAAVEVPTYQSTPCL